MSKGLNIHDIPKKNIFTTPPQYFEQLPERIQQKIKLAEGVQLSDIPHHQVFTVPPHYFQELPQRIEQRIALRDGLSLNQLPPSLVFTTPALYFEQLAEDIEQKIKLLEGQPNAILPKKTAFSTPDGYFDDLASQIQQRVTSSKTSTWQRIQLALQAKALRYAGAFMVVALMAVAGWQMFEYTNEVLPTAQRDNGQALGNYNLAADKTVKKTPVNEIKKTNSLNIDAENTIALNKQATPPRVQPNLTSTVDVSNLSASDVSAFLSEVSPDDLDDLAEPAFQPKDAAVEVFLLNALESNKELLFEQLKDVDLKAIQKITDKPK